VLENNQKEDQGTPTRYSREELLDIFIKMRDKGPITSPIPVRHNASFEASSSSETPTSESPQYLNDVCRIITELDALADSNNSTAWISFADPVFDPDFYKRHTDLIDERIKDKTTLLASNLALHTPADQFYDVLHNIRKARFGGEMVQRMGEAGNLNDMLSMFLSDNPVQMFEHPVFQPELFKRFTTLVRNRLLDQKEGITARLEKAGNHEETLAKLTLIMAADTPCPFWDIHEELSLMTACLSTTTLEEFDHSAGSSADPFTDVSLSPATPPKPETGFGETYAQHGFMGVINRILSPSPAIDIATPDSSSSNSP